MGDLVFTVGHSTHSSDELLALLRRHGIASLIDVRTAPTSRRMPHFDKEALSGTLAEQGLGYVHMPELGGFRRPRPGSANAGWRTPGFRGYADYMETDDFERALEELERLASEQRATVMCAEGLWWRCHRRLISDALSARDWRVRHIDPAGRLHEHALTEFVVIEGGRLSYPAAQGTLAIDP